ncbi:MAG: TraR/DksA C4-type zinc finger protein [Sphaerochaeta sp.]|nr:TraR/DksA C4-type zinc finger protein [Sphaerochaeta sp.]
MTEQEKTQAKLLILERIAELKISLEHMVDTTKVVEPSVSLGRLTRMDAIGMKAVNEHVMAVSKNSLVRLENALKRLDEGTYGICIRCGEDIPLGRLEHVPEALMCVSCTEKRNKR